jgi:hypothetical protein
VRLLVVCWNDDGDSLSVKHRRYSVGIVPSRR